MGLCFIRSCFDCLRVYEYLRCRLIGRIDVYLLGFTVGCSISWVVFELVCNWLFLCAGLIVKFGLFWFVACALSL